MRLLISALSLILAASFASAARPEPSPTSSGTEVDSKVKKEVVAMEEQLGLAIAKRDIPVLEKMLADHYFDAFSDENALSRANTIARCKAGLLSFLAIEKELHLSPNVEGIVVEGLSRSRPTQSDDRAPEEQWIRIRRLWAKKDGRWLLMSQLRRRTDEEDKSGKDK